ncbi:MAG: type II secretion system F family protein [Holosporaceae bacterium]|jgi:tight adherence protein C|nr:type II secretion system F family protein [Holosporaceae bacterium]
MENIICFFVAFFVFFLIKPYSERFVVSVVAKLKLIKKIKNVSHRGVISRLDEDFEEKESIGLSSGGPMFGANVIFNFIAEKNKNLVEHMNALLQKAGVRQQNALEEFMKSKIIASISLFFIILLVFVFSDNDEYPFGISLLVIFVVSVIGGHKLTDINMEMLANRRTESIENGVPDLVDLLVICTESGLDLSRSIRRIARELRTSNPILADELSLTSIELEMIPDQRLVFKNLEDRTNCSEIKTLSKTLSQSIEYGSSLTTTLRDLSSESRQKRMLNAETKAAQAPTLLTLPMMFFIMPCLFIVMLGPVIIGMMKSFDGGASG